MNDPTSSNELAILHHRSNAVQDAIRAAYSQLDHLYSVLMTNLEGSDPRRKLILRSIRAFLRICKSAFPSIT